VSAKKWILPLAGESSYRSDRVNDAGATNHRARLRVGDGRDAVSEGCSA
jgi:hypothetical protein